MFNVKTLNAISPIYQEFLKENEYNVGSDVQNPEAVALLLRNWLDNDWS